MSTIERRIEIIKILCRRRHEKIENLSSELGVCERTIRRDIESLSIQYPIYTQKGRFGGVYVVDGFNIERMYMNDSKISVLRKLSKKIKNGSILTEDETKIFNSIIEEYSTPKKEGKNNESK